MDKQSPIKIQGKTVTVNPELSEFILSLIQAFLKTGYYMPSHPEAKKARIGLYETLQNILKGRTEVSFIAVKESNIPDIFIGGIFDEPVNSNSFMMKSMAEMFIPKFIEYFDRKNLSSFSMKTAMSRDEFEKFIDIMTEAPVHEEEETNTEDDLTMKLIKNDILMVSTVFNVDIVGKGRKLPWRIEVSLSRLKRDLNMIPLYKNMDAGKMSEIRKMVFEDIIRPLKSTKLIEEMLANLDLISSDLVGFDPEEFENKIIEHVDEKILLNVSKELVKSFSEVKSAFDQLQEVEILIRLEYLKRITRTIAKKLVKHKIDDVDLFFGLVRDKILEINEIPDIIRNRVLKYLSLESYLESPEKFYDEIKESSDSLLIKEKIHLLFEFLPVLFTKRRYEGILEIFILSKRKKVFYDTKSDVELTENISKEVCVIAETLNKDEALELLNVISSLDNLGIYLLADLLDNENRFVRRSAVEMLPQKGKQIIPFLLGTFAKKEGWHYIRNVLIVLSHLGEGDDEIEKIFRLNLQHDDPNVRKEAVQGISVIFGLKSEGILIPLLKDADVEVRKRVVSAFSAIRSSSPKVFNFFIDVLTKKITEDDIIFEHIINTLVSAHLPDDKRLLIEDALIALLKESSILRSVIDKSGHNNHLKAPAINALASVGTSKSLKVLDKYSGSKDPVLNKAAVTAVEKIKDRERLERP